MLSLSFLFLAPHMALFLPLDQLPCPNEKKPRATGRPAADLHSDLFDRQAFSLAVAQCLTFRVNAKGMPFVRSSSWSLIAPCPMVSLGCSQTVVLDLKPVKDSKTQTVTESCFGFSSPLLLTTCSLSLSLSISPELWAQYRLQ